jgi:hypothetical protein
LFLIYFEVEIGEDLIPPSNLKKYKKAIKNKKTNLINLIRYALSKKKTTEHHFKKKKKKKKKTEWIIEKRKENKICGQGSQSTYATYTQRIFCTELTSENVSLRSRQNNLNFNSKNTGHLLRK